jgi:GT2 family glycosyltransferase
VELSIIITSWNTRELLRACLHSISTFPPKDSYEVIVVENASSDGSAEMIQNEFPDVTLIRNASNLGYAQGNNQGAECAKGKYLLLLGSDTEVRKDALQEMLYFMNEHVDAGAAGCKLVTPDGKLQPSCKRFPTPWNAVALYCSLNWLNARYLMKSFNHDGVRTVDQPDATCLIIRKEIVNSSGLFDERFTILYNDVELCRRIWDGGWKIYFIPSAVVMHHGSRSTKQATPKLRLEMYRNILLYYRIHFGRAAMCLLLPILFFRFLIITRSVVAFKLFLWPRSTKNELAKTSLSSGVNYRHE